MTASGLGIAVVIPAYNAAQTIGETLDAVLAQKHPDLQVIVVDDGSHDRTPEVVSRFGKRVTYARQENQGVSAARNRGVALATKPWIAFCDADDVWYEDKIRTCVDVVGQCPGFELFFHDYSVVYSGRVVAERGSHSEHTFFPLLRRHAVTIPQILPRHRKVPVAAADGRGRYVDTCAGNAFQWMIVGNFIMPSGVLLTRRVFQAAGGFDVSFRVAEDTELFLRLARLTDFVYIDRSLHYYRRSAGSLISNVEETIRSGIRGVEKNCVDDPAIANEYRRWISLSMSRRLSALAYFHLTELDLHKARESAFAALRYDRASLEAWKVLALAALPRGALDAARRLRQRARGGTP